jgi:hypothetical protein
MNLNGDEKRIQQLFLEVSRDDQRRAPQFAGVLAAARSGLARSQNRTRSLRLAIAVTMLCLAMLMAMVVVLRPSKPRGLAARDDQGSAPPVQPEAPPSVLRSQPGVVATNIARKSIIKRARHPRTSDSLAIAMKSLSSWQSPTASLLKTPGDELLRSLPRLGESLQTIKPFSPDQFN